MFEYKSNVKQVIDNIKLKTLLPANVDNLMLTLANTIWASNLKRIHNDGFTVEKRKIGRYSIKPIYVNPKNSPKKFATGGKYGVQERKSVFSIKSRRKIKSQSAHKTRYFSDGYYGFRGQIGAENSFVNLQLSGALKANYRIEKTPYGYVIGFINSKYALIAAGKELQYKAVIWGMTTGDKENVKKIVKEYLKTNT